jgi:hypothetical protein
LSNEHIGVVDRQLAAIDAAGGARFEEWAEDLVEVLEIGICVVERGTRGSAVANVDGHRHAHHLLDAMHSAR